MIYFVSDFHLGIDLPHDTHRERERRVVRWLDSIKGDATHIFLVGDIFDFWFEYKEVIPKGYVRLLGKLAELRDMGIPIEFFIGNHDMWMFHYFEDELDIPIHRGPIRRNIAGKEFMIGHGDGLGPGDYQYKRLKKVFASPFFQWCFARLHPNFGVGLANYWSSTSRKKTGHADKAFYGADKEWLIRYCNEKIKTEDVDFYIFGHRHLPIDFLLDNQHSRYINLGEWMNYNSYATFDGHDVKIHFFESDKIQLVSNHLEG